MFTTARPWQWLFLLLVLFPATSSGQEVAGVRFRPEYRLGDERIVLSNAALMRYRVVIKALVAGLYVVEGVPASQVLADVPKRLEIEYFWPLKAKDIVQASEAILARNLDPATLQRLRPRIDQMNALYEDVRAGDRYALTYAPGRGTQLSLNGQSKGVVPGADFAAAYFTIWFGNQPMDAELKRQLLNPTLRR